MFPRTASNFSWPFSCYLHHCFPLTSPPVSSSYDDDEDEGRPPRGNGGANSSNSRGNGEKSPYKSGSRYVLCARHSLFRVLKFVSLLLNGCVVQCLNANVDFTYFVLCDCLSAAALTTRMMTVTVEEKATTVAIGRTTIALETAAVTTTTETMVVTMTETIAVGETEVTQERDLITGMFCGIVEVIRCSFCVWYLLWTQR